MCKITIDEVQRPLKFESPFYTEFSLDTINWKVVLTQKKMPKRHYCFKHPYEKQD